MMKTHLDEEEGIWLVKGEGTDGYCLPVLGYFHGKYKHVLATAKTLSGWTTWGRGGSIEKINIVPVNESTQEKRTKLQKRKIELEEELKQINSELY